MKILYITPAKSIDYLHDCVFIGLCDLFGNDVVDSKYIWYLSKDITDEQHQLVKKMHGKGVTMNNCLFGRESIDRTNIEQKISDHYFDLIVYGSIIRCSDYLDLVIKTYKKNEIIFCDGEDDGSIRQDLAIVGTYFKRELYSDDLNIHPISFSFPKCKIRYGKFEKDQYASKIIPNFNYKYDFDNEEDYYNEYRRSMFALTFRKNGWDCLRHYEIIFNGCIPYFKGYENKPKRIMSLWPSDLQTRANKMLESKTIDGYSELFNEFFTYANKNLTCDAISKKMVEAAL